MVWIFGALFKLSGFRVGKQAQVRFPLGCAGTLFGATAECAVEQIPGVVLQVSVNSPGRRLYQMVAFFAVGIEMLTNTAAVGRGQVCTFEGYALLWMNTAIE